MLQRDVCLVKASAGVWLPSAVNDKSRGAPRVRAHELPRGGCIFQRLVNIDAATGDAGDDMGVAAAWRVFGHTARAAGEIIATVAK